MIKRKTMGPIGRDKIVEATARRRKQNFKRKDLRKREREMT